MRSRITFVIAFLALTLAPRLVSSAAAQDPAPQPDVFPVSFMPASLAGKSAAARPSHDKAAPVERSRPSILMTSLYATTALVQGMDAHSTLKALDAGATERNAAMKAFTARPPAFVALKTGAAAGLIFAGRRLARHSKVQAAVALIAVDSAYFFIAAHNYKVANRLR